MNIKKYGLCCFYAFSVMGCGNNQLGAKKNIVEAKQKKWLRQEDQRQLESQRHMNRSSQRILDRAPQWVLNGETQWMLNQAYQRMFGEPQRMWPRAPQRTCRIGGWHGNLAWLLLFSAAMNLVLVDADATPSPSNSLLPSNSLPSVSSEEMDNDSEEQCAFNSPQSWFYEISQRPLKARPDTFQGVTVQIEHALKQIMHKEKNLDDSLKAIEKTMEEAAQEFARFEQYNESILDARDKIMDAIKNKASKGEE